MSKAAYLRMYVPEERLDGYLEHVGAEHLRPRRVLTRGEYGVWYESARDDAFVAERGGRRYVCPRHPRLRMLEGLIAFRNSYPGATASMLVPPRVAERAADELDRIQNGPGRVRSHILTSPFFVPLRWFAAFEPSEREMAEGPHGPVVRYWTTQGKALPRVERAVDVLDTVGFEDFIVEQVRDVAGWLRPFPSESQLELDYGGVAGLFPPAELASDESAADIHAALDALERGDFEASTEHYGRVAGRWAHAQSLTYVN